MQVPPAAAIAFALARRGRRRTFPGAAERDGDRTPRPRRATRGDGSPPGVPPERRWRGHKPNGSALIRCSRGVTRPASAAIDAQATTGDTTVAGCQRHRSRTRAECSATEKLNFIWSVKEIPASPQAPPVPRRDPVLRVAPPRLRPRGNQGRRRGQGRRSSGRTVGCATDVISPTSPGSLFWNVNSSPSRTLLAGSAQHSPQRPRLVRGFSPNARTPSSVGATEPDRQDGWRPRSLRGRQTVRRDRPAPRCRLEPRDGATSTRSSSGRRDLPTRRLASTSRPVRWIRADGTSCFAGDDRCMSEPSKIFKILRPCLRDRGMPSPWPRSTSAGQPDRPAAPLRQELQPGVVRGLPHGHVAEGTKRRRHRVRRLVHPGTASKGKTFRLPVAGQPAVRQGPEDDREGHQGRTRRRGFDGRFGAGLPATSDGRSCSAADDLEDAPVEDGGGRIAVVFNGSPCSLGDAGSGMSEIRRWIIENDWLDAIIGLPDQLFYNTGISTYIWVVTNRKRQERRVGCSSHRRPRAVRQDAQEPRNKRNG